ncbi:type II secretion system protein GspG [candidate division WOR-3 bacterium]|nr:type II secretion system protein GspG [candidate division WOR-3 bacterium]
MKRFIFITILFSILSFSLFGFGDKPLLVFNEEKTKARFEKGKLTVDVSFSKKMWTSLSGEITAEIIDVNDNVLLSEKKDIRFFRRSITTRFIFKTDISCEELFVYRLRVNFESKKSKTTHMFAISQLMDKLELIVLGQNSLLSGSKASIRIITLNYRERKPIRNAFVKVTLKGDKTEKRIFKGRTNKNGSIDAIFTIPEVEDENLRMEILAETSIGKEKVEYTVTMKKVYTIYLVTDKPVYQPNQIIHIRTLTLQKPSLKAVANVPVTLSVEDSKGNKVFKKSMKSDKFGIVSCDFQLADEINMGDYRIRAEIENSNVEKTVNVKRYVLPKFKIILKTDRDYYLPSETLKGDMNVNYFFGKPVDGGKVVITLSKFDVGFEAFQEIKGETDSNGNYHFDVKLPSHFVGTPLEQGKAFIKIDIEVTDKAEHREKLTSKRVIAKSDLSIVLIPESGSLVPGIENILYVMVTYPDGTPAKAGVTIKSDKLILKGKTDNSGISEFLVTPSEKNGMGFDVQAVDEKGNSGVANVYFSYNSSLPHILLRTDKGIYKVGNVLNLTIFSSKKKGVIYLDIIKDKQTVLTKTVNIKRGVGKISIPLTSDVSGSIWIHSYTVAAREEIMRDTKVIYVNPANDLSIVITPDKKIYKPGEDGRLKFSVRNKKGHPVISALGISIVDESVFALTEMQPGLEKVYFTLEKELMEPKYEIHYLSPREIVKVEPKREMEKRKEKAAKVLFASVSDLSPFNVEEDNTRELDKTIYSQYSSRVWNDLYRIQNVVYKFYEKEKRYPTVEEGLSELIKRNYLVKKDILDPWGMSYEAVTTEDDLSWFGLLSYGPDKKKGTADDINTQYYRRGWGFGQKADFLPEAEEGAAGRKGVFAKNAKAAPVPANGDVLAGSTVSIEKSGKKEPRIREYFPETFIFEPALITDKKGVAVLPLKWPDSITEWRVTTTASSILGQLGSTTKGIKVFQDFFIDIDLPVSLTQNDIVSVPVALYNYIKGSQKITLTLQKEDWYELLDDAEKSVNLKENEVSVVYFRLRAKDIGRYSLTMKAIGSEMSDAIRREIEIVPDGKKFESIVSDRLDGKITKTVYIPETSIDGSGKIFIRIFPGMVSQVVEGMESMLGMPFGCFEQTSSVTYPNILVLDYMREMKKITPEIEMKAEQYINVGYQRLLSYEVKGGGFEWFGNAPANRLLTAYGLMEFYDMSKVFETDPNIVTRTQRWLISEQNKDGSWSPDESYCHMETWHRIIKNRTLPTAYILWSLAETGYKGKELKKAAEYVANNLSKEEDAYILAICANAFVSYDPEGKTTERIIKKLVNKKVDEKDVVYWESGIPTFTYAKGKGADIEATALATYALIKYNRHPNITNKAINYLVKSKYPGGTWGSTQATFLSLKCLLASLKGSTENVNATVSIYINGKSKEEIKLNRDNADLMFLVDLAKETKEGNNDVTISIKGKGTPMYEIASRYYLPWKMLKPEKKRDILSIDVKYDKTTLSSDDIVTCYVVVRNNIPESANMVIIDLGIPPGFSVESADLQELVGKKIKKYNLTARQVILYVERIDYNKPLKLSYRVKAKFPIKAKTPTSKVYKYYEPEVETFAEPVDIVVKG